MTRHVSTENLARFRRRRPEPGRGQVSGGAPDAPAPCARRTPPTPWPGCTATWQGTIAAADARSPGCPDRDRPGHRVGPPPRPSTRRASGPDPRGPPVRRAPMGRLRRAGAALFTEVAARPRPSRDPGHRGRRRGISWRRVCAGQQRWAAARATRRAARSTAGRLTPRTGLPSGGARGPAHGGAGFRSGAEAPGSNGVNGGVRNGAVSPPDFGPAEPYGHGGRFTPVRTSTNYSAAQLGPQATATLAQVRSSPAFGGLSGGRSSAGHSASGPSSASAFSAAALARLACSHRPGRGQPVGTAGPWPASQGGGRHHHRDRATPGSATSPGRRSGRAPRAARAPAPTCSPTTSCPSQPPDWPPAGAFDRRESPGPRIG